MRDEFAGAEGFGDVVVGADGQSEDGVDFGVAGGEHDDVGVGERAYLSADFQSIDAGQADVEDDDIGVEVAGDGDRIDAVARPQPPRTARVPNSWPPLRPREVRRRQPGRGIPSPAQSVYPGGGAPW